MAATTISTYSDALESQVGSSNTQAPANLSRSKVVTAPFIWTCAAEASGTSIAVAKIPKGARILSGILAASATLANSATLAVGIAAVDGTGLIDDGTAISTAGAASTGTALSDLTTAFKAAAAQGATQVPFAITSALGFLYETQKEVWLTLTTGTGAVTTEVVRGYVQYAVD